MLAGPGGDPSELPWAPSPGPGLGLAPRRRRRLAALTLGSGPPASAAASLAALALGLALGRLALGRLALVSHSGGRVRYSGRRRPSTGDSHCSHTACKQCKAHTESHNAQMDHGVTMGSTVHRQTQVHKLPRSPTGVADLPPGVGWVWVPPGGPKNTISRFVQIRRVLCGGL